jgi:hypothetical protein
MSGPQTVKNPHRAVKVLAKVVLVLAGFVTILPAHAMGPTPEEQTAFIRALFDAWEIAVTAAERDYPQPGAEYETCNNLAAPPYTIDRPCQDVVTRFMPLVTQELNFLCNNANASAMCSNLDQWYRLNPR